MSIVVNGERLWQSLMDLATVGAYTDDRTGLVGVNRLALTDDDAAGRRLVMNWMLDAGLDVRIDSIGNIFGRRSGTSGDAEPVVIGSHIDSVATAGAFDGCLGVLGGIEMVRRFDELGIETLRPIEVAIFTEEEGVRFGTDMLGSAVVAGRIGLDEALALTDRQGQSVGDELVRHGFAGESEFPKPFAYVECHIEQGPVLAIEGFDIGVVTGVQGISWQEVTVLGRSAHAGTTPTELRSDAMIAAARVVVRLQEMVESGEFGDLRATVGSLDVRPGLTNIVASQVVFTVDLRNPDDAAMARAEAALAAYLDDLDQVEIRVRRMAKTSHVPFDARVQEVIAAQADSYGLTRMSLLSGAGHDAQEMAAICPTAMIFVPGEFDGISHNPREYSTPEACTNGVNVLASTVLQLASLDAWV